MTAEESQRARDTHELSGVDGKKSQDSERKIANKGTHELSTRREKQVRTAKEAARVWRSQTGEHRGRGKSG